MAVKGAAKATFAVNTGIANGGSYSSDMYIADLAKRVDGYSIPNATPTRDFAETGEEKAFKESVAHCVPVGRNVRE